MHKLCIVDQIEYNRTAGTLGVRLNKQVINDDGSVFSEQWHRFMLTPFADIDATIALVNNHLVSMGSIEVGSEGIALVKSFAELSFPPGRYEPTADDSHLTQE